MKPKSRIPYLVFLSLALGSICALAQAPRPLVEKHVMRSLRAIQSAQATYQATIGAGNYGTLENLRQVGFIDDALASGNKFGYLFAVVLASNPSRFSATAAPRIHKKVGRLSFYIDSRDGEIRGGDRDGGPAVVTDPIIDDCTSGTIIENERCVIQDMRAVVTAQMTYAATAGDRSYGTLQELYAAGLIRAGLVNGSLRGYSHSLVTIDYVPRVQIPSFKLWRKPITYGVTGIRSFYADQSGVLRGADKNGGDAGPTDPPIE